MLLLSVIHAYSWPLVGTAETKHQKKKGVLARETSRDFLDVFKKKPPLRPSVQLPSDRDFMIRFEERAYVRDPMDDLPPPPKKKKR
jgi:hypothetical protein